MRVIAGAAGMLLAATAATALAAHQNYEGKITGDPKAAVELRVKVRDGKRFVTRFTARRLPLECEGDTEGRLQRARVTGAARVSGEGRFTLAASNETQRLRVRGRLVGNRKAKGSVRYSGLTEFAEQTLECEARGLRWKASR